MTPARKEQFQHNGKTYEVRVVSDIAGYKVRAFDGDRPVSPGVSMTYENASDFALYASYAGSAIDQLIQVEKDYVVAQPG